MPSTNLPARLTTLAIPDLIFAANAFSRWLDLHGFNSEGELLATDQLLEAECAFQAICLELEARGVELDRFVVCPEYIAPVYSVATVN